MITIITNEITFKVKVTTKENGSNYNVWAHIYKPTDKMPIAGTSFKTNSTAQEIREWASNTLNNFDINFLKS